MPMGRSHIAVQAVTSYPTRPANCDYGRLCLEPWIILGMTRAADRRSRPAVPYIGSSVIRQFVPTSAPQLRFNCLNKPVSAHPCLYCAQVRPYLLTRLCEGSRAPTVLPVRCRDARLALRGFWTSGKATMQPTLRLTSKWRFLARGAAAGSGAAALTGVFRAGTRLDGPA